MELFQVLLEGKSCLSRFFLSSILMYIFVWLCSLVDGHSSTCYTSCVGVLLIVSFPYYLHVLQSEIPALITTSQMFLSSIYSDELVLICVLFSCSFAYSHRNAFGRNQKLNVSLERGQVDSMFRINYTDPWIEGDDKRTSRAINIQVCQNMIGEDMLFAYDNRTLVNLLVLIDVGF